MAIIKRLKQELIIEFEIDNPFGTVAKFMVSQSRAVWSIYTRGK